ncbi:hypothetical protein C8Q80DRAFT_1193352 [Daedaleopsis nitida]|nr:hypothetical protein C8Q80DRAFT_1193352 [Daedaleopsis nitida]
MDADKCHGLYPPDSLHYRWSLTQDGLSNTGSQASSSTGIFRALVDESGNRERLYAMAMSRSKLSIAV